MARPIAYIAPSLLVGLLCGYLAAGGGRKAPSRTPRAAAVPATFGEEKPDEVAVSVDYRRLAQACIEAAGNSGSRAPGSPTTTASPSDVARAQAGLIQIEEHALTSGVWSRVAGFKAQALLTNLPREEGEAFMERISEQIRTGSVRRQFGAWLPEDYAN